MTAGGKGSAVTAVLRQGRARVPARQGLNMAESLPVEAALATKVAVTASIRRAVLNRRQAVRAMTTVLHRVRSDLI
jgi:hypothetical protein